MTAKTPVKRAASRPRQSIVPTPGPDQDQARNGFADFEDEKSAKTWLRTPNRAFHDVAPMEYLDTEPGAMAVRQVLTAIATGCVS